MLHWEIDTMFPALVACRMYFEPSLSPVLFACLTIVCKHGKVKQKKRKIRMKILSPFFVLSPLMCSAGIHVSQCFAGAGLAAKRLKKKNGNFSPIRSVRVSLVQILKIIGVLRLIHLKRCIH
ncbi:hypothetical protein FKM82_005941 [Ascaphus truei]